MYVIRPVVENDLPTLLSLALAIEGGLTTLPAEERVLRDRIESSLRAFDPHVRRPGAEYYLFVLEDVTTGEVVGTSGIAARVGGFDPFYSYEIRTERFAHASLRVDKVVRVLHLKQVHTGPSEVGSLYLRSDLRGADLGRLMSLARFLFMAAFPARFDATVIAELRGFVDEQGRSPFWEAVGHAFFDNDFYTADALSGIGNKEFIADLMPRHPIYIPLLPEPVQSVIGRVHRDSTAALAMLKAEGFAETTEVDIFDAGPQVRARVDDIRTVREAKAAVVRDLDPDELVSRIPLLVANRTLDFRCGYGNVEHYTDGSVSISTALAVALHVKVGDSILFAPAR